MISISSAYPASQYTPVHPTEARLSRCAALRFQPPGACSLHGHIGSRGWKVSRRVCRPGDRTYERIHQGSTGERGVYVEAHPAHHRRGAFDHGVGRGRFPSRPIPVGASAQHPPVGDSIPGRFSDVAASGHRRSRGKARASARLPSSRVIERETERRLVGAHAQAPKGLVCRPVLSDTPGRVVSSRYPADDRLLEQQTRDGRSARLLPPESSEWHPG